VSEDHLDRHRDFDNYLKCKLKIFKHQGKNEWCIFGADNKELSFSIKNHGIKSKKLAFGLKKHFLQGAYLAGNKIVINFYEKWILDLKDILLVGKHNYQNIMAALLIAQITHCNFQITKKTVCSFKGLSHRLEWVRTINSVSFYNDSKGTNVAATLAALESLSAPIVLVAGGLSKGGDFLPLRKFVPKKLRGCVVIGDAAAEIARTLDGTTAVVKVNCLEEAVKKGWELAKPRGNVLLSPACASFDMFNDYKERGDIFKRVVHGL
jgi:UDP-N-acetylmuramoylalanine--D-glutamate ligase